MKRFVMILAAAAALAVAQAPKPADKPAEPPKAAPAPAAPAISADDTAAYFKAKSDLQDANAALQEAQRSFQQAIAKLVKDCGDKHQVQLDQAPGAHHNYPMCVVKAEPTAAAPAAKK